MEQRMTVRRALSVFIMSMAGALFLGYMLHLALGTKPRPVAPLQRKANELVILCAGDSITAGGYPGRLYLKLKEAGIDAQVVNCGVPGYTSREFLHYMMLEAPLRKTNPDVVLLQLGTNDVRSDFNHATTEQFIANMRQIIARIKAQEGAGRRPALLIALIPPVVKDFPSFSRESVRRVTEEINPAIRKLAAEHRLILIDHYSLFAEHPTWMDGIHPTPEGYQAMADNWFRILKKEQLLSRRPRGK